MCNAFPTADVIPFLRRAIRDAGGLKKLAKLVSERIGGEPKSRARMLTRIMGCHQCKVSARVADELAIGLGLHPMLVWPRQWEAFAFEVAS